MKFHVAKGEQKEEDADEKIKAAAKGGFDVRFEVVGAESALFACIHTVKPGGREIMVDNSMAEIIPVHINRTVLQEVHLIGSVFCARSEFDGTIDLNQ